MAARFKIIILEKSTQEPQRYRAAMWADVPAARQSHYANPDAVSQWTGALQGDIDALKSGAVAEKIFDERLPDGATNAQIQSFLQQRWLDFQGEVNNRNPWVRYGSTWDGTTWVMANNP